VAGGVRSHWYPRSSEADRKMNNFRFIATPGDPKPDDFQALATGLLSHHASQGHPRTWQKFCIFLKDDEEEVHAGIIVTFLWNGMHIDSLWVSESIRTQGWGRRLMELAEQEARNRGCTIAYTDTFSWQAPGFYEKLGYSLYGRLEGFPEGNALSYYSKELS
jgi:ribosomal protein S18 acetylase RimI-like enzyme